MGAVNFGVFHHENMFFYVQYCIIFKLFDQAIHPALGGWDG